MYEYEPVLLWVRVLNVWHAENEDNVTLCDRRTPAEAVRSMDPAEDDGGARCPECVAVRRRLQEVEGMG